MPGPCTVCVEGGEAPEPATGPRAPCTAGEEEAVAGTSVAGAFPSTDGEVTTEVEEGE